MKMNKKGNVFNYLTAGVLGLASFVFILIFVVLMISTVKSTSIVAGDSNATYAITQTQTAINLIPQFMQIIVIAIIFAGLLGLIVFGGMWGYNKMKGQ
jgi:hypothetical protein